MLNPTLADYVNLAARGKRTAIRKRIPADLETPVSAFLKLRPHGAAFLLESVERGIQVGRYSFIGISPYAVLRLMNDEIETERDGVVERIPLNGADPFSCIRAELANSTDLVTDDLPGPFAGAVGYVSYDIARYLEPVPMPKRDQLGFPDLQLLFPRTLAVFDHVKSEIEILTLPAIGSPESAYAEASRQIDVLLGALGQPLSPEHRGGPGRTPKPPVSNLTETAFRARVLQAKEHILAGDAFQIVLSQRFRGDTHTAPFQVYRALRILNPSPYMFFVDFGGFQAIGSSPEVLVKLDRRRATLSPIAGTRPRGSTSKADLELEQELLANEKERAEHVMLVDLGRNDLGRVCRVGSVALESLMQIEKYSHVMHIVSRITGELRSELDMFDLLKATFPAGTVTGAPKIRAMQIISELETDRRGAYAGAVGYFGRQGNMDLCIAIRTLFMKGTHYFAQAGAGIVADSDPDFEYRETLNKILALTQAITMAEEGI